MTTPTVLISGATDGIGLALAQQYADRGAQLLLLGRRPRSALPHPLLHSFPYCPADLADPDAAGRIVAWLDALGVGAIHLAYLNAATGYVGPLAEHDPAGIARLIQVNFTAQTQLVQQLAPRVAGARGRIVLISSAAAPLPTPDYAVYTATKAALEGFAGNLRSELRGLRLPIALTVIRPGATRTGLHAKSGATQTRMDWSRFAPADRVAAAIIRRVEQGRATASIGLAATAGGWIAAVAPALLTALTRRRTAHSGAGFPLADRPHIVITGAAAGIGRALAHTFSAAGASLSILDCDRNGLATLTHELSAQGCDVAPFCVDLADLDQVTACLRALTARPPITALLHNAGINATGPFLQSDPREQARVTAVNLTAPLVLTAGLLRAGHLAQSSTVVFVASLSHFVGYPGAAVYAASKDGLVSFTRSLAAAFPPSVCRVLTVFPGPTRTGHAARHSPNNRHAHRRMDPTHLARLIRRAVKERHSLLIPGAANVAAAIVGRLAPPLMDALMRRVLFDPMLARDPDRHPFTLR